MALVINMTMALVKHNHVTSQTMTMALVMNKALAQVINMTMALVINMTMALDYGTGHKHDLGPSPKLDWHMS